MLWAFAVEKTDYRDVVGHFRRSFEMMQILLECDGLRGKYKNYFLLLNVNQNFSIIGHASPKPPIIQRVVFQ